MPLKERPRRRVIAGNWKMYKTRKEGVALVDALLGGIEDDTATKEGNGATAARPGEAAGRSGLRLPASVDLIVFPPYTAIDAVAERCRGTRIAVGAQNLHPVAEGAYTGEISPRMLLEAGATHVLIGHSERRQNFGEDDELLARKVRFALENGLTPVFCLGETLAQRDAGETETVLDRQLRLGLGGLDGKDLAGILIAYEPVWAIGTGRTATPEQARDAHAFLRTRLLERWADEAPNISILYGGSVKPSNAAELLSQPDVDGALVGGASLDPASFLGIAAGAL